MAVQAGKDLVGLAVVTLSGGERLGRVGDLIFHLGAGRVTGFLVDTGGLLSKRHFLPAGAVQSLGTDALTVSGPDALQDSNSAQRDKDEIEAKSLDGRPVLTEAGTALGKIADVLVNTDGLTVPAFSVATGFVDDALHGKPHLPLSLVRTIGPASIVVANEYDPKAKASHAALG